MTIITAALLVLLNRGPMDVTAHIVVAPAETLSVTMSGAGAPIVIIPGLLGGAYGFRKVSAELEAQHDHVVIVNPLGMGGSSRPRDADYSMQAQAVRVAAALDSLHVHHAHLVGQAAGVPVVLRLALLRPDLVSSITAVNGSASEKFSSGGIKMALRLAPILKLFGGEKRAQGRVVNGLRESSVDRSWVTDDVVKAYTAPYKGDLTSTLRILSNVADADEPWALLPRLQHLRVPVILLLGNGAEKPGVKPDEVAAMKAALPSLKIETYTNVGHFIQEERPDLLVHAIKSF